MAQTTFLHERLDDLLVALAQNDAAVANQAPARVGTDKDPLLPKSGLSSSLPDSDDDFEDIMRAGRPSPPPELHQARAVTNAGTFFHLLKAYFSPALLTMPKAMSHLGLVPGVIGIFILGTLFTYCIHVLLQVNRAIVNRVAIDRKIKEAEELVKRIRNIANNPSINSDPKDTTSVETLETTGKKSKENKDPKNGKLRFSLDFEQGESSSAQGSSSSAAIEIEETTGKKSKENKDPKNGKLRLSPDFEQGESSSAQGSSSSAVIEIEETKGKKSKKLKKNKDPKNWKLRFAPDFEQGESSSAQGSSSSAVIEIEETKGKKSKKLKKNKDPKNWKLRFAPDFEQGESSSAQGSSSSAAIEIDTLPPPPPKEDNPVQNAMVKETISELLRLLQNNPEECPPGRTLHYDKLIALSFHYGTESNKWLAKPMIPVVQILMYLTHYGCCCVCFLFTAESLGELATKGPFTHSNSFEMVAYAVPFIICISFIPDRHEMTAVTTVAFLLQLCGLGMMIYYLFIGEHSTDLNLYGAPANTWYLYFGLIFYAFEGTGVSMHVESHMARKQAFLGWKGILNCSMYLTIPMYAIVGGLGYWKYGNEVKSSVSFNLPEEHIPDMIQILMGIGVLLTYPFHMSFLLTPLKKLLMDDSMTENCRQMFDILLRVIFVVSTYLTSAMVPFLELQLSVLGATASCFLVLLMPAFMSLNSYAHLPGLKYGCCRIFFHFILMLLGSCGSLLCSYMNFKNAHFYYPNSTIF